jgi:hypothetical protein
MLLLFEEGEVGGCLEALYLYAGRLFIGETGQLARTASVGCITRLDLEGKGFLAVCVIVFLNWVSVKLVL